MARGMTAPDDTIAAISTPPGEGGIGIVRLSGPASLDIASALFRSRTGRDPRKGGRIFHGDVVDGDVAVDEVLLHVMRAPHSYTCEDVVEINGHGGAAPLHAILELVLRQGARLAEPGEFTKRAFLNGRIDLVQAEAVIDRIRAHTRAGLRAATAAASGALSQNLYKVTSELRDIKAVLEAAVDFPDQDVPELITPDLRMRIEAIAQRIRHLLDTAEAGRLYREGATVAIAGRPNVGKSSLFNALLRESRAIVTQYAGTTRDLLEEIMTVKGIPVRLTDTAGLRETQDEVEKLGVAAARTALGRAAAILFVQDASMPDLEADRELIAECRALDVPVLQVLNKIDLVPDGPSPTPGDNGFAASVRVSATDQTVLDTLESALATLLLGAKDIAPDQGLVTRLHQRDSLRRALEALERLLGDYSASPEFLALELDDALRAVGEITGETTPDDVLERIFGEFCIGK